MTRERRSLWGSISTSNKVNKLSIKAALLYTWAISHFDDEGFQDGEPKMLKHEVVPYRDDIPLEEIKPLFIEIVTIHHKINDPTPLWRVFHVKNRVFIQDPVFHERQTFHGIHKIPSKIKPLVDGTPETVFKFTANGVLQHLVCNQAVRKRSEVKLSKVKGSEELLGQISTSIVEKPVENQSNLLTRKEELQKQAIQLGVKS